MKNVETKVTIIPPTIKAMNNIIVLFQSNISLKSGTYILIKYIMPKSAHTAMIPLINPLIKPLAINGFLMKFLEAPTSSMFFIKKRWEYMANFMVLCMMVMAIIKNNIERPIRIHPIFDNDPLALSTKVC